MSWTTPSPRLSDCRRRRPRLISGAACGHCGARLHAGAFRELELVEQVTPGQIIVNSLAQRKRHRGPPVPLWSPRRADGRSRSVDSRAIARRASSGSDPGLSQLVSAERRRAASAVVGMRPGELAAMLDRRRFLLATTALFGTRPAFADEGRGCAPAERGLAPGPRHPALAGSIAC